MAKFGSGKKPKNQGSSSSAHSQKPATSSAPGRDTPAPQTPQTNRGFHTAGQRGTKPGAK